MVTDEKQGHCLYNKSIQFIQFKKFNSIKQRLKKVHFLHLSSYPFLFL